MPLFDPENPFPLWTGDGFDYSAAQAHAAAVDQWLGIETESVELRLREGDLAKDRDHQLWIGLPTQSLLTPYTEIRQLLHLLAPPAGSTVVDLGAAYGRMGLVLKRHHPGVNFIGYEYVEARVNEGRKLLGADELLVADLSSAEFRPAAADFYFLYDYGSRRAIDKTLDDLRAISIARKITVVGRGRASRDAIERGQPWLSQVVPPEHFPHFSIYRTGYEASEPA